MPTVPKSEEYYANAVGYYDNVVGYYDNVDPYYEDPDPKEDTPRSGSYTSINRALIVQDGGAVLDNQSTFEFIGDGTQGQKALPVVAYAENIRIFAVTGSPLMPNVVPWLLNQQFEVVTNAEGFATHVLPRGLIRWATGIRFLVLYNASPV